MSEMLFDMIEEIRLHGIEKVLKRYYGVYRGIIASNTDSQNRGRITVSMPAIMGEEILPTFALPKDIRGGGQDKGNFYPPDVKDGVWVEFEAGDLRFPVYSGGWLGAGELNEAFAYEAGVPTKRGFSNKYGHTMVFDETEGKEKIAFTTPAGHFFVMDDTNGAFAIYLIHDSGAQMQMDNEGNVKIFGKDGSYVFVNSEEGDVSLVSAAGAYVSVGEAIKLQDSSGENWATIDANGVTLNAAAGTLVNGNSFGVSVGSVDIRDTAKAGLVVGNGQVALGNTVLEIFQGLEDLCTALTSGAPLVSTGVGPSSGILPPTLIDITILKAKIAAVKGSL